MQLWKLNPWPRNYRQSPSGKTGAVQPDADGRLSEEPSDCDAE